MNTLDDLRATLESHAHEAAGLDTSTRRSQVGGRIAAARRRRAAVRGGATLAVVVAVASVVALPQLTTNDTDQAVASRTLLGEVAPATKTALGLTYAFEAQTATEDGTAITLEPTKDGDQAPLLTWTTLAEDALVTVTEVETDEVLWTSTEGNFADHVVLDQWESGPVTIAATTPGVGAALYVFDPDAPVDGVTAHGTTFRQTVAGRELLFGDFSELGDTALEIPYDIPDGRTTGGEVTLTSHCSGAGRGGAHAVFLNGEQVTGSEDCTDEPGLAGSSYATFRLSADQRSGTLEVRLVRGSNDPRPVTGAHPDVLLGAALYEPAGYYTFDGLLSDHSLEQSGHLWAIDARKEGDGTKELLVDLTDPGPHLVSGLVSGQFEYDQIDRDALRLRLGTAAAREVSTASSPEGLSSAAILAPADSGLASILPTSLENPKGVSLVTWRLVE